MPVDSKAREDGPRSKRARILTVAVEQFGKVGYEHTKWASVAGEVGIGQTALYHYFESKAHCLLTIMRIELAESVSRFDAGTAGISDPEEALRAAVAAALEAEPTDALQRRILQNHMDILSTPRQSEKEETERVQSRELVAQIERNWTELLKRGMESGAFAPGDPELASRLVLGAMVSVWRWYRPGGPISPDDMVKTVTESLVRMVKA
ncbi:TetR/AcrR family transcriptional regulator [Gordonia rubripertincta]|uniref:TetR/AcrR family transcriptional regulator n=1 Tax=Gordonia rubripertincta TaxID=36822 RepID=UPI0015F84B23|nr:TetR/AcrR family transcriptional regulator [Gordonia rubripertincta]QMU21497.1 TetR/AcrR family transcriptional regulator [Gordonia rubripertincta]